MNLSYHDGHAGHMPDYHDYNHRERPRPRSNSDNSTCIPRPPYSNQPPMTPDCSPASRGRGSPRRNPERYDAEEPTREASQGMCGGSGREEDYGPMRHYRQWPLPGHLYEQPPRTQGSLRRPPTRLHHPDDSPQPEDYRLRDPPRSAPHVVHAGRPYLNPPALSHHGNGQWNGEGSGYAPPSHPPPNRPPPKTPPSRQVHSAIPQYPPAQMPLPAVHTRTNQRAPLGPPPSARRGPAAYFPDVALVHPIVEENDSMRSSFRNGSVRSGGHDSKASFASSNAIPIGIAQVYLDNHTDTRRSAAEHASIPEGDHEVSGVDDYPVERSDHAISPSRDQESPEAMVRQASVGKKSRPRLTEVKSGTYSTRRSSGDQEIATPANQLLLLRKSSQDTQSVAAETERSRALTQEKLDCQGSLGAGLDDEEHSGRGLSPVVSEARLSASEMVSQTGTSGAGTPEGVVKSGTGLLDMSESSTDSGGEPRRTNKSKELLATVITDELHPQRIQPLSPSPPRDDERVKSILESLEKGGAISAGDVEELRKPMGGLSEKARKRCPPRLNVDAVRDAEARGSLTSLPDLIMRATRLASNLDRGRTASRLGMNWFEGADDNEKRRSGSISDALNSFPLPYNATLPGSRGELRRSKMSGRHRHSTLPSDSDSGEAQNRKRRCCGMPLWIFLLLMLLLLILIAAAVVLPVVFVVLPKQDNKDYASVGSCERKLTCENGGANILSSNGYCECICRNGYYGRTCSNVAAQGCTTSSIGMTDNATLGEAIPRLLEGSQSNFSIPLDGRELLGLFSSSDLSCVSQNALVTFNNEASKRSEGDDDEEFMLMTPALVRAAAASSVTSDGGKYATGLPTQSSSAPASTSAASSSVQDHTQSNTTLDFARVAVLYIFQASGDINSAATAQERLQTYFQSAQTNNGDDTNATSIIALGGTFTCDLTDYTINVGNGTAVGGGSG